MRAAELGVAELWSALALLMLQLLPSAAGLRVGGELLAAELGAAEQCSAVEYAELGVAVLQYGSRAERLQTSGWWRAAGAKGLLLSLELQCLELPARLAAAEVQVAGYLGAVLRCCCSCTVSALR